MFGHKNALAHLSKLLKNHRSEASLKKTYDMISVHIPQKGTPHSNLNDLNKEMKETDFYKLVAKINMFFNDFKNHNDSFPNVLREHDVKLKELIKAADQAINDTGAQSIHLLFKNYNSLAKNLIDECESATQNSSQLYNLLLHGPDAKSTDTTFQQIVALAGGLYIMLGRASEHWNELIDLLDKVRDAVEKGEDLTRNKLHELSKQGMDSVIKTFTNYAKTLHQTLKSLDKEEGKLEKLV